MSEAEVEMEAAVLEKVRAAHCFDASTLPDGWCDGDPIMR
jgi:hypothetical protein